MKTQNLINAFNASITVETEDTYNRMSRAMFEFNKSLFNPLHTSYYNDIDVEILNRCRTVAPAGKFRYFCHNNELHLEIDQNKAYTYHLTKIVKTQFLNNLTFGCLMIMKNMTLMIWANYVYV